MRELWPPWGGEIAFAHRFRRPPYGGSNQFLLALRAELGRRGVTVSQYRIGPRTRACLLNAFLFDEDRVRHSGRRVLTVHRVDGPVARYRGFDDGTDARVAAVNAELADVTVFQSQYSLEAHRELGIELREPVVIPNAVDPAIFHSADAPRPLEGRRVRLISTSWSPNPNKGLETYRWLDRNLDWTRYEFTFVGQSPIAFERIRHVPPVASRELADLLRAHDVYVTASRADPCSNALLEALACGLPALYLDSGGHPELVGAAGVAFSDDEELPARLDRLVDEYDTRRAAIAVPSIEEVTDRYLAVMGFAD